MELSQHIRVGNNQREMTIPDIGGVKESRVTYRTSFSPGCVIVTILLCLNLGFLARVSPWHGDANQLGDQFNEHLPVDLPSQNISGLHVECSASRPVGKSFEQPKEVGITMRWHEKVIFPER